MSSYSYSDAPPPAPAVVEAPAPSVPATPTTTPTPVAVLSEAELFFADFDLRDAYLDVLAGGAFSDEAIQALNKLTDAEFVDVLYTEILRREADPYGLQFWTEALGRGISREFAIDVIARSFESLSISSPDEITLLGQRPKNGNVFAHDGTSSDMI
jgi:hypothetical protein